MLIGNGSIIHKSPARFLSGGGPSVVRNAFNKVGMEMGRYLNEQGRTMSLLSAKPSGYYIGTGAWSRPRTAGQISSFLQARAAIATSGSGVLGLPGTASTTITIQFADAEGQLITSGTGSTAVSITTNTPLLTASLSGTGATTLAITTNTPILGALASAIASASFTLYGELEPFATGSMDGLAKLAGDIVVLNDYGGAVYLSTDGSDGVEYPAGTATFPVKTMTSANYIANKYGLKNYYIRGSYALEQDHTNTSFYGFGPTLFSILELNNKVLDGVQFNDMTLTGQLNTLTVGGFGWQASRAKVEFHECFLHEITNLQGNADLCTIDGTNTIAAGGWLSGTRTVIDGDNTIFDLQSTSGTTVSLDIVSGYPQFINAVTGCLVELNVKGGEVRFDATCTGGEYYLEGVGTLYNEGAMTKKENHFIWDELQDGSYSGTEMMRVISSALAGKVSGAETGNPVFRSIDDTKDRITAVTDTDGNRTSVTIDSL